MPPCSRRRGARPPLFRIGGSLSQRVRCVVLGSSRSLRVAVGAVAGARRSRRRCLRHRAGAPSAGYFVPPCSRRRNARPPLYRGGGSLSRRTRSVVLGCLRSLHVNGGAVAVARRSRHRCLRRCAGAPSAGLFVPPCSRRRDARPPLFRGGGSLSRHAWCVSLGSSRSLRVAVGAATVARRSRRRSMRRRAGATTPGLFLPPCSRRRGARPPLFRWRRLALSARAVRRALQLAVFACGSGGGRRRAAPTALLPAAPRWRS